MILTKLRLQCHLNTGTVISYKLPYQSRIGEYYNCVFRVQMSEGPNVHSKNVQGPKRPRVQMSEHLSANPILC